MAIYAPLTQIADQWKNYKYERQYSEMNNLKLHKKCKFPLKLLYFSGVTGRIMNSVWLFSQSNKTGYKEVGKLWILFVHSHNQIKEATKSFR